MTTEERERIALIRYMWSRGGPLYPFGVHGRNKGQKPDPVYPHKMVEHGERDVAFLLGRLERAYGELPAPNPTPREW